MEYKTPGVYIREVDSGPKPIESVSTAVPGFIGLFEFNPEADAIAITGSNSRRSLQGKVIPQLVDSQGNVGKENKEEAGKALTDAFRFKARNVKDLKKLLNLNGHSVKLGPGSTGRVRISDSKQTDRFVDVAEILLDTKGAVITDDDQAVEDMLNSVHETFALDKPAPSHAKDLLQVYGFKFEGAAPSALNSEYSIPPVGVTNKSEFFRWLQSFFAEYLLAQAAQATPAQEREEHETEKWDGDRERDNSEEAEGEEQQKAKKKKTRRGGKRSRGRIRRKF